MDNARRYDAGARLDGVIVQKMAAGDRLAELDLNPLMAGADAAAAVDWLMITR
jgi:hypothetical protein